VYSPTEECRERDKSGYGEKVSKKGAFTNWRAQREGHVRTQRKSERAWDIHFLEITEGGTSQDPERKNASKGHLLPGEHRRDKSGNENKAKQARDTHKLEGAVETSQDTKRKRASEGHSLPGKHIERTSQHTGKKRASRVHPLPGEHKVGQVRTRSESEGIRGTHGLKSAEGRISQDTEKASEGHAQT